MITSANKSFSIEYNTRLPGFMHGEPTYVVNLRGKLKPTHPVCPACGHNSYVENGYHGVEDSIILSLGLRINIGQFSCKKCGAFWSTNREPVDALIQKEKELVKSLMLGSARSGLSFAKAANLIGEHVGFNYSAQYLHELYTQALSQVKQENFSSASGVYYYDEQYLLVNSKEACRLTIKDVVTGKVLVDAQTENAQKETIKSVMQAGLDGLPADAFIVDMKTMYPDIIHEQYPKAQIQWCIFHLYKLIWKELQDDFGKKIPLLQLYNAYTIFDLFFNHAVELEKLQELLILFDQSKTREAKSSEALEGALRKEFAQFVKKLKNERRNKHENVPRRTLEQSEQTFADVEKMILLYPKKLQKRIRFISENWDRFTLFQRDPRVQPTSNGIEQYFAATLAKTDKKNFRSIAAVTRELNAYRAEWNGHTLFPVTNLVEVLTLVGRLFLAFPP